MAVVTLLKKVRASGTAAALSLLMFLPAMIGAFPRRLLVRDADRKRARALLIEAGYGSELRDE